jgi:tetratricopeptide (TPR) repeat protein
MVPKINRLLKGFAPALIVLAFMVSQAAVARNISSPLVLETSDNVTKIYLATPKKVSFTLTFPSNQECGVTLKGLSISAPLEAPTPESKLVKRVRVENSKEGITIVLKLRSPWLRVVPRWLTHPTRIELLVEKLPPKEEFWLKAVDAYKKQHYQQVVNLLYSTYLGNLPKANQITAMVMLADALYHTHRYKKAIKVATRLLDTVKRDFRREKMWEIKIRSDEKAGLHQLLLADVNSLAKEYPQSPFLPFAEVMKTRALLLNLNRERKAIILLKDLIASLPEGHPAVSKAKALLGLAYYLKKNYLAAYMLLKQVQEERKEVVNNNPEYLFALGRSAFILKKYKEAKKALSRVFNVYPNSPEASKALALTGDILLTENKPDIASWIFDTCNRLYPDTKAGAISKLRLAYIAYTQGKLKKALSLFGDASFLYPQYPEVTEFAALRKAEILLELKRYNDAILAVQDFTSRFPTSKYGARISLVIQKAKLALADREFNRKRYLDALLAYNDFVTSFPNSPFLKKARTQMGNSLMEVIKYFHQKGDCLNMLTYWSQFKKYMPKLGQQGLPYYYVGLCYQSKGETDEAISIFEHIRKRLGKRFSKLDELRERLAIAYDSKELFKKAASLMWKNTKAQDPFRQRAFTWLLDYSFVLGQEKAHRELAQSFARLYPRDGRIIYDIYRQGLLSLDKGKDAEAMGWFRAVVEQYRKLPNLIIEQETAVRESWLLLGKENWLINKDKEALRLLTNAASLWPNNKGIAEALFLAGYSAKRLKKEKLAKILWDKCKKEFPDSYWSREIEIRERLASWKSQWAKEIPQR